MTSSRRSFIRKIIYGIATAALFMPLYSLSHPATNAVKGSPGSPGGKLARLRNQYRLSESQIGEIDPTSVSMKLATLGMRGIAANILWEKAFNYKMKKDWTNLAATLNQITKIQPHFISIWSSSVTWNLSYNVSVEFDDYRQRYRWVIRGIDFLKEGIKYNDRQPRLHWDMGWTISHKIGKSDESKQFRKLFKEDDDFHGSRPLALRDNWLVGKEWFDSAVAMVDSGVAMMGKNPLVYRADSPLCQMSYAEYLEKDGTFGEVAKAAWTDAAKGWSRYGAVEIPTSLKNEQTQQPLMIRLGEEELKLQAVKKLTNELDAMQPGLRAKLIAQKRTALPPAQREALETPPEKRTPKQVGLAAQAEMNIAVTHNEVARKISAPKRKQAIKLSQEIADLELTITYIHSYRDIMNFVYWRLRADVEQTDEMISARKFIYQGDRAYAEGDLVTARNAYRRGMEGWRRVLDKHPSLVPNVTTTEDLVDVIKHYRRILAQLDEPFPQPFILQDVLDANEQRLAAPGDKRFMQGGK